MRDTRRTRIVLALLLLTAFTFITLDARGGGNSIIDRFRSSSQSVLGPIERAAAAVVRPVSGFIDGLTSINSNQDRIDELQAENDALRRERLTDEYDQTRVQELDKLLNVAGLGRYRILPAQVISVAAGRGYARTVTIDAGTRDGLTKDLTVINGDGLVGRIIEVSSSTATVLLMTDPTFAVGARLAGSLETGAVTGQGSDPLDLELFNPQAKLSRGDLLVTMASRNDKPFVAGVPIGEVTAVTPTPGALTRSANVRPFATLTALDLVGVIVEPPRRDPRDSVLPPSPTPTPTPSGGLPLVTPPTVTTTPQGTSSTSSAP
ncbi:MAG TPA: rod shape-determining protein MreC [Actinomycetes bacterium]|nr:rod shape-determining protein MreC [Actinomycetes bacterium]